MGEEQVERDSGDLWNTGQCLTIFSYSMQHKARANAIRSNGNEVSSICLFLFYIFVFCFFIYFANCMTNWLIKSSDEGSLFKYGQIAWIGFWYGSHSKGSKRVPSYKNRIMVKKNKKRKVTMMNILYVNIIASFSDKWNAIHSV